MGYSQLFHLTKHLQEFGNITQMQALKMYGVMNLKGRIFDLRQRFEIITEMVLLPNKKRIAKYIYVGLKK